MIERRTEKWFDQRVEAYVDGDLPRGEARLFEARLETDAGLRTALAEARAVKSGLTELPRYRCPTDLSSRVARITGGRRPPIRWLWPAAAAAALGALAITITLQRPDRPSEAELAHAQQELAVALAYLDRAGATAGEQVGTQMINNGWVRPVERGINPHFSQGGPSGEES